MRVAEFDILYGEGISKTSELVEIGSELGIIEKSGSWFSYNGNRLAQGKENCRKYLEENPDIAAEVEEKIRAERDKVDELLSVSSADSDDDDDVELSLPAGE